MDSEAYGCKSGSTTCTSVTSGSSQSRSSSRRRITGMRVFMRNLAQGQAHTVVPGSARSAAELLAHPLRKRGLQGLERVVDARVGCLTLPDVTAFVQGLDE